MNETWQPIESAPKDGMEIDLWSQDKITGGYPVISCHYHLGEWLRWSGEPEIGYEVVNDNITHWRPIERKV